ncbi:hypothetical protein BDV06DRAFT_209941 [Aspergillus oleicola]
MHLNLASPRALRTGAVIVFIFIKADPINWSCFAYTQYVTNIAYLCNLAECLMMYPDRFSVDALDPSSESRLLRKAREEYGVRLMPIKVTATCVESHTKLLAFNQTQYERVLSLDSDTTIIQPSEFEFMRVMAAMLNTGSPDYDIVLILPHRPYDPLTGEFWSKTHSAYMGNDVEVWDPNRVLGEANYLYFSDRPVLKPWLSVSTSTVQAEQPTCDLNVTTCVEDYCRARDHWLEFYADFATRRKAVCGFDVP